MVIDASAMVEWLLKLPKWQWVAAQASAAEHGLHAPYLLDIEVTQVLRKLELRGGISPTRAEAALEDLLDCPVERLPHEPLLWRVWEHRSNLTAYDALYIALGEALKMPVLTTDTRMAACPGVRVPVLTPY